MPEQPASPRIIVALDYADPEPALQLASRLDPASCRLKVGFELFTATGGDLVRRLVDQGHDVFLDLKYHDIPNTVARACTAAARLGAWMVNVHALGGRRMLEAARDSLAATARPPLLIAVTILTSHDGSDLGEIGLAPNADENVSRLAQMAADAGLDGVVCSAREAERLRKDMGDGFLLVTPGIRGQSAAADDQRRTVSATEALSRGADFLVIGRPITAATDPALALDRLRKEIGET